MNIATTYTKENYRRWDKNFYLAECLADGIDGFENGKQYPVIGWNNGWHIFGCNKAGDPVEIIAHNISDDPLDEYQLLTAFYVDSGEPCKKEAPDQAHFVMYMKEYYAKEEKENIQKEENERAEKTCKEMGLEI